MTGSLLQNMIPGRVVRTVFDIDLQDLRKRGVKGIITDLDNTLVGARDPQATPELIAWFRQVKELGFQTVIVSNNSPARVAAFADPLGIPYIAHARKPLHLSFRRALQRMGLSPQEAVVVGDQLLTDVFGGNRAGIYTVLVMPISLKDEGFMTKFNRRVERRIKAKLRKAGHLPGGDKHDE